MSRQPHTSSGAAVRAPRRPHRSSLLSQPANQNVERATTAAFTLALRREDAARAVGVSEETFDRYVRPSLPVVRIGAVRVYPVSLLERWLVDNAEAPADELRRLVA